MTDHSHCTDIAEARLDHANMLMRLVACQAHKAKLLDALESAANFLAAMTTAKQLTPDTVVKMANVEFSKVRNVLTEAQAANA